MITGAFQFDPDKVLYEMDEVIGWLTDRDLLLDLAEAHELEAHARLPWWNWKRWTR